MLVIDSLLGKLLTGHEEAEVHIQESLKMLIGEISKMQIMSILDMQKGQISSESISI